MDYLLTLGEKKRGLMTTHNLHMPYEHGIATWAVGDAVMTHRVLGVDDKIVRRAVRLLPHSANIIVRGQTELGGWVYSYERIRDADMSISVWNLYALETAVHVLGEIPKIRAAIQRAGKHHKLAADANGGYRYRIQGRHPGRLSLAGNGLVCHRIVGTEPPFLAQALREILEQPFARDADMDLHPIVTQTDALFAIGGSHWLRFDRDFMPAVADAQNLDGSWPEGGGNIAALKGDTTIYKTCLGALILEVYYR